jgi:membrane associated rhomboid family serine protease
LGCSQVLYSWIGSVIVGIFLISTVFQYRFGEKQRSFPMRILFFLPLGFIVSLFSALIGATGPVENPFYFSVRYLVSFGAMGLPSALRPGLAAMLVSGS